MPRCVSTARGWAPCPQRYEDTSPGMGVAVLARPTSCAGTLGAPCCSAAPLTALFPAQIRLRCQKGIPPSLRGRAWQYLSGSKVKLEQNVGKFDVSVTGDLPVPAALRSAPSSTS